MEKNEKEECLKVLRKIGSKFKLETTIDGKKMTIDVIVSKITKFKDYYFVYANHNTSGVGPCGVTAISDNVFLILRDMHQLIDKMGLSSSERKCIYFHEIAHKISPNQKHTGKRLLEDEIDADSFAIEELGADPIKMRSALIKTKATCSHSDVKKNHSKEEIEAQKREMEARIKNVERIYKKRRSIGFKDDSSR